MGFKINPLTGALDVVNNSSTSASNNFSYKVILNGQTLTIPINQQMVLYGDLEIQGDGELVLDNNSEVVIL